MTGSTLYLSGPMTGRLQFNFPAFHDAAVQLRGAGYHVLDAVEHIGQHKTRHVVVDVRPAK